jgi:hypothetical protein
MILVVGNKIFLCKEELEDFSKRDTITPGSYKERWVDKKGGLHREDGPAIIYNNGSYSWYKHGAFHRVDGPAVSMPSWEGWFIDALYHREGGPAYTNKMNGNKQYFLNGAEVTEEAVRALGKMK